MTGVKLRTETHLVKERVLCLRSLLPFSLLAQRQNAHEHLLVKYRRAKEQRIESVVR